MVVSPKIIKKLPINEAYSLRNRTTHDYDRIDLIIIEQILTFEFRF